MKLVTEKHFCELRKGDLFFVDKILARALDVKKGGFGKIIITEIDKHDKRGENYIFNEIIAIKGISTKHINEKAKKLFREEIINWSKFKSPKNVPLLGILEDDEGDWYTCMPRYNCNLSEFLNSLQSSQITYFLTFQIITDIAYAMMEAYENNVLHLDIKPSNILVNTQRPIVHKVLRVTEPLYEFHLSDWGISGIMTNGDATRSCREGGYNGTIPYMSPERLNIKRRETSHKSDVYSLGLLLFEVITGTLPFSGLDSRIEAVINEIVSEDYFSNIRQRLLAYQIDPDISDLILKMTDPSPSKRPNIADCTPHIVKTLLKKNKLNDSINPVRPHLKNENNKLETLLEPRFKKTIVSHLFSYAHEIARYEIYDYKDNPIYMALKKGFDEELCSKIKMTPDQILKTGTLIELSRLYENSLVISSFREFSDHEKTIIQNQIALASGIEKISLNIENYELNTQIFTNILANKLVPGVLSHYHHRFHQVWENKLVSLPMYLMMLLLSSGKPVFPDPEDLTEEQMWGDISLFNDHLNENWYYYLLEFYKGKKNKNGRYLPVENEDILNHELTKLPSVKYSLILYQKKQRKYQILSVYDNDKSYGIRQSVSWSHADTNIQATGAAKNIPLEILSDGEMTPYELMQYIAKYVS